MVKQNTTSSASFDTICAIFRHLGNLLNRSIDSSVDGFYPPTPWVVRVTSHGLLPTSGCLSLKLYRSPPSPLPPSTSEAALTHALRVWACADCQSPNRLSEHIPPTTPLPLPPPAPLLGKRLAKRYGKRARLQLRRVRRYTRLRRLSTTAGAK